MGRGCAFRSPDEELAAAPVIPDPYAHWKLAERLSTWGLEGFGSAELTVRPTGHAPVETRLSMRMGAIGVTGALLDGSGPSTVGLTLEVRRHVGADRV